MRCSRLAYPLGLFVLSGTLVMFGPLTAVPAPAAEQGPEVPPYTATADDPDSAYCAGHWYDGYYGYPNHDPYWHESRRDEYGSYPYSEYTADRYDDYDEYWEYTTETMQENDPVSDDSDEVTGEDDTLAKDTSETSDTVYGDGNYREYNYGDYYYYGEQYGKYSHDYEYGYEYDTHYHTADDARDDAADTQDVADDDVTSSSAEYDTGYYEFYDEYSHEYGYEYECACEYDDVVDAQDGAGDEAIESGTDHSTGYETGYCDYGYESYYGYYGYEYDTGYRDEVDVQDSAADDTTSDTTGDTADRTIEDDTGYCDCEYWYEYGYKYDTDYRAVADTPDSAADDTTSDTTGDTADRTIHGHLDYYYDCDYWYEYRYKYDTDYRTDDETPDASEATDGGEAPNGVADDATGQSIDDTTEARYYDCHYDYYYDYCGYGYEYPYATEPATMETAAEESADLPISMESSQYMDDLNPFTWSPRDLLLPVDKNLLRTLNTLFEEPSGVREALLNEYIEGLGLDAVEFVARFEEAFGNQMLMLHDDLPGVAALLATYRMIEQGEFGMDEAVDALQRHFNHLSPEWIEDVSLIITEQPSRSAKSDPASSDGDGSVLRAVVAASARSVGSIGLGLSSVLTDLASMSDRITDIDAGVWRAPGTAAVGNWIAR